MQDMLKPGIISRAFAHPSADGRARRWNRHRNPKRDSSVGSPYTLPLEAGTVSGAIPDPSSRHGPALAVLAELNRGRGEMLRASDRWWCGNDAMMRACVQLS
jgi:hypothetical protein